MTDIMTGYQAFAQLQAAPPDGTTCWHSLTGNMPTATAALAESVHYIGHLWFRAARDSPLPNPYLFTVHGKHFVRVAVVPCGRPHNLTMSTLPDSAAMYELVYPPAHVHDVLTFAAAAEPIRRGHQCDGVLVKP